MTSTAQDLAARAVAGSKSSLERIDFLDGWRGLAIGLVLASHFAHLNLLDAGRFGVDVFFVLSGMLMSRILFVNRTPLPLFYKRRISRIFPVFLLFVATVYSYALIRDLPFTTGEVGSTLVFLRTYLPADPGIWRSPVPIGHVWSLNVEEHCYVILSLFAFLFVAIRRNATALFATAFVTLATQVYYHKVATEPPTDFGLRTECSATCLMLSAGYFLVRDHFRRFVRGWMPTLALVLAAACYAEIDAVPWYASFLFAPFCLAFAVNHLGDSYRAVLAVFSFAPLRLLGIWSYSIYLWQQPFYKSELPSYLSFIGAMTISLASFYLFENPTRAWLNDKLGSYPAKRSNPGGGSS